MKLASRVPPCTDFSRPGMFDWFNRLGADSLLFHPDDDPEDIVRIDNGARMFDDAEVEQIRSIFDRFFVAHQDVIYEAALASFAQLNGKQQDS